MANVVWHKKLQILLDLTQDDLDHPELPGLWETVYRTDRYYGRLGVPVSERDLQCGGVCRDMNVDASIHLRMRNGRREAVHERREDEERHTAPMSDEHKAYQERILRAADEGGFSGDSEVRTRVGRSWIQTDTLVEGADGRRIGWEIQMSTIDQNGLRGVRARAAKAAKNGITPAWHTDRAAYAQRNDTHWTRSDHLPAYVIARTGDLRIVSGFRVLDFWRCDVRTLYSCPDGIRRCGKTHATPKPRDVLFDDMVRQTAAGTIVPVQFRAGTTVHRFWATNADRDRLDDLYSDDTQLLAPEPETDPAARASRNRPTCRPAVAPIPVQAPPPQPGMPAVIPAEPSAPAVEAAPMDTEEHEPRSGQTPDISTGLPSELNVLQQVADEARHKLEQLQDHHERDLQRQAWRDAAAAAQAAVTHYARAKRLNRYEVEKGASPWVVDTLILDLLDPEEARKTADGDEGLLGRVQGRCRGPVRVHARGDLQEHRRRPGHQQEHPASLGAAGP
ncbi:hypothetical protein [Streptomyces sp. 6-11-2]|uniref:hypothetical protein n=1 Tax=Streptomyces sp. 6-11-2 TaxID=2585753 RepID=UPI00209C41FD|nr:hypothetical protein [Streptomyces sp. 6-11-2]